MKNRITLTDKFIKGITIPDKRTEFYDDVVSGLILRVTKTGHKAFAFRYWYDGQSKQITIGKYGDVTLSKARELVKGSTDVDGYKDILRNGKDPLLERQTKRETKPVTLAEYIEQFKDDYVKRRIKASTQKTYKSRLNKILNDKIAKRPLEDISRSDVRKFLKTEAKKYPINANRMHSILSKLFNEAIEDELLSKNPIKDMEKISDENIRDPHYSEDDIRAIWQAIENEWQPMQGFLKMLLITGQRVGETSRMKWKDIHDDTWIISIAEQKTGKITKRQHKVPLSGLALDLLNQLETVNGASEYVFASLRNKEKPLTYFQNANERIRSKTGLHDFRIHDLRHIIITEMARLQIPQTVAGKVTNHKKLSGENHITARYNQYNYNKEKRTALYKWAKKLKRITTGKQATISI